MQEPGCWLGGPSELVWGVLFLAIQVDSLDEGGSRGLSESMSDSQVTLNAVNRIP